MISSYANSVCSTGQTIEDETNLIKKIESYDNTLPARARTILEKKKDKTAMIWKKGTIFGIRWSIRTQLLTGPSVAQLGQSGRDAVLSAGYGRTW